LNNATNVHVTETEYALSITQLVCILLQWTFIITAAVHKNIIIAIGLLVVQAFNIAYSAYIIEFYNSQAVLPNRIIQMTLAILILNSLAICGCFAANEEKPK
jgi:hypothetical protein